MKKMLQKRPDAWESIFDNLLGNEFGQIMDQFSIEYPYYKSHKYNGGKVNLYSDDKDYKVELSVPGFAKEELNIEIKDGV